MTNENFKRSDEVAEFVRSGFPELSESASDELVRSPSRRFAASRPN